MPFVSCWKASADRPRSCSARLGIGYTRASRLMDLMTEAGIVGAFKGSKAREVFMSLEDWDESQKALGEG